MTASTVKVLADGTAPVSYGLDITKFTSSALGLPTLTPAMLSVLRMRIALVSSASRRSRLLRLLDDFAASSLDASRSSLAQLTASTLQQLGPLWSHEAPLLFRELVPQTSTLSFVTPAQPPLRCSSSWTSTPRMRLIVSPSVRRRPFSAVTLALVLATSRGADVRRSPCLDAPPHSSPSATSATPFQTSTATSSSGVFLSSVPRRLAMSLSTSW